MKEENKAHRLDNFVARRAAELGWFAPHSAHSLLEKWLENHGMSLSEALTSVARGQRVYSGAERREGKERIFEIRESWDISRAALVKELYSGENLILSKLKQKGPIRLCGGTIEKPIEYEAKVKPNERKYAKKKSKKT